MVVLMHADYQMMTGTAMTLLAMAWVVVYFETGTPTLTGV
jgi:hypothetical protein